MQHDACSCGLEIGACRYPDCEPSAADDCDHEDYDIDVCTGRASCNFCDATWYLNSEALNVEFDRQASYHEDCERWERQQRHREFWRKLTLPIRWPIFRLLQMIWPRKSLDVLTDDEIPF